MAESFVLLSGSTSGKAVKVAATSTPGTTIHTAHATNTDLISLWAQNNDADGETRTLTLEWGGTTDPDNLIVVSVPCKAGPIFICDRIPLTGGLLVKAFADEANDVQLYGFVVRSA